MEEVVSAIVEWMGSHHGFLVDVHHRMVGFGLLWRLHG